jgi:hypothetical protein
MAGDLDVPSEAAAEVASDYGTDPYGSDYGTDAYGSDYGTDPYGADSSGTDPYGTEVYGTETDGEGTDYGTDGSDADESDYGSDAYGSDPYGADGYGETSLPHVYLIAIPNIGSDDFVTLNISDSTVHATDMEIDFESGMISFQISLDADSTATLFEVAVGVNAVTNPPIDFTIQ